MASWASAQEAEPLTLLSPVVPSDEVLDREDDPLVIRQGYLSINIDMLTSELLRRSPVEVNLFNDVSHRAVIDSSTYTEMGWRFSGALEDQAYGSIVLAVTGNAVSGTVRTDSEIYQIRTRADSVYVVTQINPAELAPEAQPLGYQDDSSSVPDPDPPALTGGSTPIDLLVLYNPATRELAGGRSAISSLINLLVEQTNRAFTDSDVEVELLVVGAVEVPFEKTNPRDDVRNLMADNDGILDEAHRLRDRFGADLVYVLVDGLWSVVERNICGIAGGVLDPDNTDDSTAFAMSSPTIGCYLTFAHEVGHLLGLSHDHYAVNANGGRPPGAFPYSYGYVSVAEGWRTIMAYPSACSPNPCHRLPRFSNPRHRHSRTGSLLGDLYSADAARSLNNTGTTVANFR